MLKMLLVPQFLAAYVILALIVASLGRNKQIGFWGFLLLSLLITPLVTGVFMIINRDRRQRRLAR
jgi:hypothetical protein